MPGFLLHVIHKVREEIFLLIIFAISIYLFKKSSLCNWQDSYNISMELHIYVAWTYCSFFAWFGIHVKREVPLLNNHTVPCNAKTPYKPRLLPWPWYKQTIELNWIFFFISCNPCLQFLAAFIFSFYLFIYFFFYYHRLSAGIKAWIF